MSRLELLPPELRFQIVAETIPEDFENVRLVCKTLNAAATPFLEQYMQRRQRFRHVKFPFTYSTVHDDISSSASEVAEPTSREIMGSLYHMLLCIAQEPIVARYIQTVDFRDDPIYRHDPDTWRQSPHPRGKTLALEDRDRIRDLLRASPQIREAGVDADDYFADIMNPYEWRGVVQAFLLTLLPNVTTLTPGWLWDDWLELGETPMRRVMDATVRMANAPASHASLSKLRTVRPSVGEGYDERLKLTSCSHLLALDSLRAFYAGSMVARDDGYTGYDFKPYFDRFGRNLETIELYASVIGGLEMRTLLSRTPNLKNFRFAQETKWHGCGYDWDIGGSLAVIQELVGGSLVELSVTLMGDRLNNEGSTLTDMSGFLKLKALELDFCLLCGPAYNKGTANLDEDDDDPPVGDPAMVRLVDLLPPSIENVRIYNFSIEIDASGLSQVEESKVEDIVDVQIALKLFEGLDVNHCDRLPHLEEVCLVLGGGPYDPKAYPFQQILESGCIITSAEGNSRAMPYFASSFPRRFGVDSN
ncbi:hypothetical protein GGR52DRAFT_104987 [Hypoxylon sp. FL1284]|nr:hypothetical protein GGR52DRAFT_104987 [Hypoxylon sp. FL1284]